MKIPTFDDLKRAVAALVHTQKAKRPGNSGSRLIWPLALACGFLIFATASSIYRVRSSQASGDLVNSALRLDTKIWVVLNTIYVAE